MDKQLKKKEKLLQRMKEGIRSFMQNYIALEGNPEQRQAEVNQRLNHAAKGLCASLIAFLFGSASMMFYTYPLGIAFLCASCAYQSFIYVGLLVSVLFIRTLPLAMFLIYTAAFLLKVGFPLIKKESSMLFEGRFSKALLSSVVLFVFGLIRSVSGGFLWYDLFALLAGVLLAPILTLIFCGALEKEHRFTSYHDLGLCALMSFTVYSLREYTLFGFSLSAVLAFVISLYISKECGMLRGGIAGLFAGLAYNVIYAPLFAIAAIVSGMSRKLGDFQAAFAALAAGVFYGIYTNGFFALQSLAPDLLAGALVFTPLSKFNILPRPKIYTGGGIQSENQQDKTAVHEKQAEGAAMRFHSMSHALSSLAGVFYNLSCAEKKPDISEVSKGVESCFEPHCSKCPRKIICWDESFEKTRKALDSITLLVYDGARVTKEDASEEMQKKCNRLDTIIDAINENYSNQLRHALRGSKAEVFAIDYAAMSSLLNEALKENEREYEIDEALTQRLKSSARYLNFDSTNLCVYGKRKKRIIAGGIDLGRVKLGVEELQRSFERVVGVPLTPPSFSIDGENVSMSMKSARRFSAEHAHASLKKNGEDINGDSHSFFENKQDYFYALVSDGMGSGRDAALSSRLTGVYLDKMLRAGNKKAQSLEMLNSFLRQKNCESFATVDLFELDLLNGEASFVKSGAAPSYILRGTSVFKIASNTMPVGIINEINAEEVKFELCDGDIVVMASDGICEGDEDGIWLMDMITNDWEKGMTTSDMCQKILEEARERTNEGDDMTVSMIKIKKIR